MRGSRVLFFFFLLILLLLLLARSLPPPRRRGGSRRGSRRGHGCGRGSDISGDGGSFFTTRHKPPVRDDLLEDLAVAVTGDLEVIYIIGWNSISMYVWSV